jgi:hypothetical protein
MGIGSPYDLISDTNVGFTSVFTALICITSYILGADKISKVSQELLAVGKASTSIDFVETSLTTSSNEGVKLPNTVIHSSFIPKGIFLSIKKVGFRVRAFMTYLNLMFKLKFSTIFMVGLIMFYLIFVLPKLLINGYVLFSEHPSISEMLST